MAGARRGRLKQRPSFEPGANSGAKEGKIRVVGRWRTGQMSPDRGNGPQFSLCEMRHLEGVVRDRKIQVGPPGIRSMRARIARNARTKSPS